MKRLLLLVVAAPLAAATNWPVAAPASEGFREEKLEALKATLPKLKTKALVVARHGRIVFEYYDDGVTADTLQGTASMAKALVGGMSLLVALDSGRMGVDDLASKYIPAWKDDPRKKLITIRQLATHSSGIEDAESAGLPHTRLDGWKGEFWARKPRDPITVSLADAPVVFPPGSKFGYSNPGMAALGYAITASLRETATPDLRSALAERVCRPIGISDQEWRIGYSQSYAVDGMKVWATWGGGSYTPRATARIGQLMLENGKWNGKQLFQERLVRQMVSFASTPIPDRSDEYRHLASGLAWWTNFDGVWPKMPRDAFAGAGAGQEVLLVVPSLQLVVVRNGGYMSQSPKDFWVGMEEFVFNPLMDALGSPAPPRMKWGDTSRLGRPFAKDPSVIRFGGRYLLYYSVPGAGGGGWGVGIAESRNLVEWKTVATILPKHAAPFAKVVDGQVHLFYQTYGNGPRDAICHAVSKDGLHFSEDPTNPVFRPTGDWNAGRAIDAEVAHFKGRWFLYAATRDPAMKVQMLVGAVAEEGRGFGREAWRMLPDGPLLKPELPWEQNCIEAPTVVERDGVLYMFYAGAYNNAPQQIGCARSRDGIHWERLGAAPFLPVGPPGSWNASESGHPGVFVDDDGETYLFYQGNNDKGRTWYLSFARIGWSDGRPYLRSEP